MVESSSDLAEFVAQVAGKGLRVEESLGQGFVRLRVDEAERRQAAHDIRNVEDVIVELLRNARDAGANHIYVATSREGDRRTITILDDGTGIPFELQERIFDARVTSKLETMHMDRWGVHGRGMALYSVRTNADSARVICSAPGKGSSIQVVSNINKIAEKADQSTWPVMDSDEDEQTILRGPHNIIRACAEFALEERGVCEVFLGSAADIVATARKKARPQLEATKLLFLESLDELQLLERIHEAADASELARVAAELGLNISERTAHRILSGAIKPLRSVYARLSHSRFASTANKQIDLKKDQRGLRITPQDAEEFSRLMERDFAFLAQRYYLELASAPRINAGKGRVTVSFELAGGD